MRPDLSMVMGDLGLASKLPSAPGGKPRVGNSSTGGVSVSGRNPLETQGISYWAIQKYSNGIGETSVGDTFQVGERTNVSYNEKDKGMFRIFSPHVHNWNGE